MRRWIDELSFRVRVVLMVLVVAIVIAVVAWDMIETLLGRITADDDCGVSWWPVPIAAKTSSAMARLWPPLICAPMPIVLESFDVVTSHLPRNLWRAPASLAQSARARRGGLPAVSTCSEGSTGEA